MLVKPFGTQMSGVTGVRDVRLVDFSGCVKLFSFIAVLFDLSSEIQSLDFVKDVSGLLSPFSTLFLSCALCHPLSPLSFRPRSQFLPRFLCWPFFPHAISLSPSYLPFLSSLSVTLSFSLNPSLFNPVLSPRNSSNFLIFH